MEAVRCDRCQQPASHHFVEIVDGEEAQRHLCAEHAQPHLGRVGGIPNGLRPGQAVVCGRVVDSPEEATAVGLLALFRAHSRLLRRLGRAPTQNELAEEMASPGAPSTQEPSDPSVKEQLAFIEGMAGFIRQHGRMPTNEDESPFSEPKDP